MSRHNKKIRNARRRLAVENLESRRLLTTTWRLSGAAAPFTLIVEGDSADNNISVFVSGGTVQLTADAVTSDTATPPASISLIRVSGRLGNDTIAIQNSVGTIQSQLFGNEGDDSLTGGLGIDTLRGGLGADTLSGRDGNDALQVSPNDTWLGGSGVDTVTAFDDFAAPGDLTTLTLSTVITDAMGVERVSASPGDDVLDASAVTFGIQLLGKAGNDTLMGGSGDDVLFGEIGNDSLFGNAGKDSLIGGLDDDTMDGGSGDDSLEGREGNNTMDGGADNDVVSYSQAPAGVAVDIDGQVVTNNGYASADTITNIEGARGSAFDDLLLGSAGANVLIGNGGDDFLIGLGGADDIDGGTGFDSTSYIASGAGVTIYLNDTMPEIGGDAQGDTLFSVEVIDGSNFNDSLSGNQLANQFNGLDGNDTIQGFGGDDLLQGGNGADILTGGLGTDSIDGGNDNDIVFADSLDDQATTFTGGAGTDSLRADSDTVAVDWVLDTGDLFETITGSNMADTIDGRLVTDTNLAISARNGTDTVYGGTLNDTINGGNDADTIYGWLGADVIRGDAGVDTLFGNDAANTDDNARDRFFGGAGTPDTATGRNLSQLNSALRDTIDAAIESDLRV